MTTDLVKNKHIEIEIRAVIFDVDAMRSRLLQLGFSEQSPITQEDIVLDYPDARMFRSGTKVRIRLEGERAELTYKGGFQGEVTSASRRSELNINISPEAIDSYIELFSELGFPECFRVVKKRNVFSRSGLQVTIDEWPIIGAVLEIEGGEAEVRALAIDLDPKIEFRNYRLKEFFKAKMAESGKSLDELKAEYESRTGLKLGRIELLID